MRPTTTFLNVPIPSISHSTSSPMESQRGFGLRKHPTPGGVPVAITSPACNVTNFDRYSIIFGVEKTKLDVDDD